MHLTAHVVTQLGQPASGLSMCRLGGCHAACRCLARCPSCCCPTLTARGLTIEWQSVGWRKWQASAEQGFSGVPLESGSPAT